MSALALAVLGVLVFQDEARLKDAWPKLAEAWKVVEAPPAPAGDATDEFLKAAGKLHEAFEAAGLYQAEGEYVPLALKSFIKARARGVLSIGRPEGAFRRAMFLDASAADPMQAFLDSLSRLKTLEQERLDDEDNVQDELAAARKALKRLGITADATPAPLRRRVLALARALASGDPYPEPARATEEQAREIRALIGRLGHEFIEEREKAARDLNRMGEIVIPLLREALKGADAEAATRARQLLGYGHAPWTEVQAAQAQAGHVTHLVEAKLRALEKAEIDRRIADERDRNRAEAEKNRKK